MTSLWRIIKFGLLNFLRNPWLSIATTLTFALTLFIISIFFLLILVSQTVTKAIEEKMDLTVYFKEEAKEEAIFQLQEALKQRPEVKDVKYISKKESLKIWQNLPISERIKQLVTSEKNPLPKSLQIKVEKPDDLEGVANYLSSERWQNLIRKEGISYQQNKSIINRLSGITKFIKKIGIILAMIFLTVSVLVIFNTIRLTIISRKDEIEIQRLVGAKNSFIQGPYLVEGVLYGFLAALFSTLFIYILLRFTSPLIFKYLGDVSFSLQRFFASNVFKIFAIQFLIGVVVGGLCSLISVKKYLKI